MQATCLDSYQECLALYSIIIESGIVAHSAHGSIGGVKCILARHMLAQWHDQSDCSLLYNDNNNNTLILCSWALICFVPFSESF